MNSPVDFTGAQRRCLDALVDTLIPPDDNWPGAVDAGAVDFLRRLLAGDQHEMQAVYKTALDLIDREAVSTMGVPFAELYADGRYNFLTVLERGDTTQEWPFSPSWFISVAAVHAAEGFYGDPGNVGNRDGVAWKMIGFEVRG